MTNITDCGKSIQFKPVMPNKYELPVPLYHLFRHEETYTQIEISLALDHFWYPTYSDLPMGEAMHGSLDDDYKAFVKWFLR